MPSESDSWREFISTLNTLDAGIPKSSGGGVPRPATRAGGQGGNPPGALRVAEIFLQNNLGLALIGAMPDPTDACVARWKVHPVGLAGVLGWERRGGRLVRAKS